MLLLLALAGTNLVYPKPMPKTQLTLAFGAPTLQLSSAPPPTSALQSALARPPSNAAGQTQAVVAPPAAAAGSSGVKKIVVDQKRPVMAKLKVGPNAERREWGWVHLTLDVRPAEVEMAAKRNLHTQKQKRAILDQTAGMSDADAAKKVRLINGFEKVKARQIKRWREAAAQEERTGKRAKHGGGRKVNAAFEAAVMDELIYTSLEKVQDKETAVVQANVAFSNLMIVRAAEKVRGYAIFKDDPKVRALKFSNRWVLGLLRRNALRRRRITASEKVLPDPAAVQAQMSQIQQTIEADNYTPAEIISADEFYGAAPKYQVVPSDAARAMAPEADEKACREPGARAAEPWRLIPSDIS